MTSLNEMKKDQVAKIALGLGLTLSYKDDSGKRQRYIKEQLIKMIEAKQAETLVKGIAPVQAVESLEVDIVEVTPVTNEQVVKVANEHLASGNIEVVKALLNKLNNYINSERKNKLLVKRMSTFRNLINSKLKMHNRKVAVTHG